MRFITEFELDSPYTESNLEWHKFRYISSEMGQLIEKSFGLNHRGCTTLNPNDPIKERFTLEIEAFPMDKWMKFKDGINECISQAKANNYPLMFAILSISDLLKELESLDEKQKLPG